LRLFVGSNIPLYIGTVDGVYESTFNQPGKGWGPASTEQGIYIRSLLQVIEQMPAEKENLAQIALRPTLRESFL